MKKLTAILVFSLFYTELFAQNEIGPDGDKLIWFLIILVAFAVAFYLLGGTGKKPKINFKSWFGRRSVRVEIKKDRVYFPDILSLSIKNTGTVDVDLDRPLLIFDNFWLKRNFRINGMNNRTFYPLYLEKGKIHTLEIDIARFYRHDRKLRKYPKVKIRVNDVKGKALGQASVYLRKTLIRF